MIDSYDKLTIGKYRELLALEREDDMTYGVQILAILTDYTEDELYDMPLEDFTKLMQKTHFLYQTIDKLDWNHLGRHLTINGKKYDIIKDARKMTAGQYIDYKAYIKDPEKFMDMLPYILTCFIIPSGCKYGDGYDVEELAKELNDNLNIRTAVCISDFFHHQSKVSIRISLRSLKWMMKRMSKKEKNQEMKDKILEAVAQMESLESLLNNSDGYIPL